MIADEIHLGERTTLLLADLDRVVGAMKDGALCLLPSDTAYSLAALEALDGATQDVDIALARGGVPLSLAFGTLGDAKRFVDLSPRAERFVGELLPGPLTFVAPAASLSRAARSKQRLQSPGDVGFRITESEVERQIAGEAGGPITTTAVWLPDGSAATTYADAAAAVRRGMEAAGVSRPVVGIVAAVPRPGVVSSVVREERDERGAVLRVLRPGALTPERLAAVAERAGYAALVT